MIFDSKSTARALRKALQQAGNNIKECFRECGKALTEIHSPTKRMNIEPYSCDAEKELNEVLGILRKRIESLGRSCGKNKKALKQRSMRDRKQQIIRSRRRQQLLRENQDKSNNWKRMHGLPAKKKKTLTNSTKYGTIITGKE